MEDDGRSEWNWRPSYFAARLEDNRTIDLGIFATAVTAGMGPSADRQVSGRRQIELNGRVEGAKRKSFLLLET
jgi:hypothetical protein